MTDFTTWPVIIVDVGRFRTREHGGFHFFRSVDGDVLTLEAIRAVAELPALKMRRVPSYARHWRYSEGTPEMIGSVWPIRWEPTARRLVGTFTPGTQWVQRKLEDLWAVGKLETVGLSMKYEAEVIPGRQRDLVLKITDLLTVDVSVNPALAGRFDRLPRAHERELARAMLKRPGLDWRRVAQIREKLEA